MRIPRLFVPGKSWLAGIGLLLASTVAGAQTVGTQLLWDNNNLGDGSEAQSQPDTNGGDYIYWISPDFAQHGVWRTVLTVTGGEASLFVEKGNPAVNGSGALKSQRLGDDAVLIDRSQYNVGEAWYIRVNATPGATWELRSGDIDVVDWGVVDNTTRTSTATIGPEGMVWMKAIIDPATTPAWGLMEVGVPLNPLYVSVGRAPMVFAGKTFAEQMEMTRGQMIATPGLSTGAVYVAVAGTPGTSINLKAFRHEVITPSALPAGQYTDDGVDNFQFRLANQSAGTINTGDRAGFRFVTYQVNVPANGLGWQVKMTPAAGMTADLYLRYAKVATINDNNAMSELLGTTTDNAVIVPPDLQAGPSYITVYSEFIDNFSFTLRSGDPEVKEIPYINEAPSQIVNDAANQNTGGWVYYRVSNTAEQLNYMGWELLLSKGLGFPTLAIRRNAIPAQGVYRAQGKNMTSALRADLSSTNGLLQDPNHEADIWYIGVYNGDGALGPFELETRAPQRSDLGFNGFSQDIGGDCTVVGQGQDVRSVRYFKVTVPAGALGWDVRLSNIVGGKPSMVVRRDLLPADKTTQSLSDKNSWVSGGAFPVKGDYSDDADVAGKSTSGQIFTAGMGSPLEPGDYYIAVGIENPPAVGGGFCYTITSRAIGVGNDGDGKPYEIQVQDLPFNGSASATLAPREIAVYRIDVPAGQPGWQLKLDPAAGHEAMLAVRQGSVPNIDADEGDSVASTSAYQGTKRERSGTDYFYRFANNGQFLDAVTYYAVVESEGDSRAPTTRVGAGPASFTLSSAPMSYVDTVADPLDEGETKSWTGQVLPYGEYHLYRVRVAPGLVAMDIRLKNTTGSPVLLVKNAATGEFQWPNSSGSVELSLSQDRIGSGYKRDFYHASLVTVGMPAGDYWVLVGNKQLSEADQQDGQYDLEIEGKSIPDVAFNGGSMVVPVDAPQPKNTWRYYRVTVPANAVGWNLRLRDVTSGNPRMVIRRDASPSAFTNSVSLSDTTWPSLGQLSVGYDFTGKQDIAKTDISGRYFTAGMNKPLVPGTYIIGVNNNGDSLGDLAYTIESQGIGEPTEFDVDGKPWVLPIQPLAFVGGSASGSLDVRDIAVYKVDVPAAQANWEVRLDPASGGEIMFAVSKDTLPNTRASGAYSSTLGEGGTEREQHGGEFFYKFKSGVSSEVATGTYYFVVVGEGQSPPDDKRTGTGLVNYTITSNGPLELSSASYVDGTAPWSGIPLEYGEVKTHRVTVPAGVTQMCIGSYGAGFVLAKAPSGSVALGGSSPSDGTPYYENVEGGVGRISFYPPGTATVITPEAGQDYFLTMERMAPPAGVTPTPVVDYGISFDCVPIPELAFNGGVADAGLSPGGSNPPAFDWYHIDVPANATGWDLRLVNVSGGGDPRMVIRRDYKPVTATGFGFSDGDTSWPSGSQWVVGSDFTGGDRDAGSTDTPTGRFFTVGMGAPLEPGSYYVGIYNNNSQKPVSYRLLSRGIGELTTLDALGKPWEIPVQVFGFDGNDPQGSNVVSGTIAPVPQGNGDGIQDLRDLAVYRVNVPAGVHGWSVGLTPAAGNEAMLVVRRGNLPNIKAGNTTSGPTGVAENAAKLQGVARERAGREYYYQFANRDPVTLQDRQTITPGTYYVVVVAEGQNPATESQLGTGSTSYTLTSYGEKPYDDKASTPVTDGAPVSWPGELVQPGTMNLYRFRLPAVPPQAIEVLLRNGTGKPSMLLERAATDAFRYPNEKANTELAYSMAADGGYERDFYDTQVINIPYPSGDYWLALGSGDTSVSAAPAGGDIEVSANDPIPLAFDGGQDSRVLVKNQVRYYKVEVPETLDGLLVQGWQVNADLLSGSVELRVRKDFLPPLDASIKPVVKSVHNEAVIAQPLLTPGTWYVEVKATADGTSYTVNSVPARPTRQWTLPVAAADFSHPGLASPMFGDSGVAADGSAIISEGQGTDLKVGRMHFYRLVVPAGNAGLLRTQLDALSGNPQLYIRRNGIPTLDHDLTGNSNAAASLTKVIYDKADEDLNSSYGHWVPLDARESTELEPGTWWIGVYALGGNVRYRLQLSAGAVENVDGTLVDATGYVQDLSPDTAATTTYTNQTLLKGDIRYYRLKLPQSSEVAAISTPVSWTITLSGKNTLGIRLRDTTPSGMRNKMVASLADDAGWQDWRDENEQTSSTSHAYYTGTGTRTFLIPELKPGATYYVAVRASDDIPVGDPFTISSSLSTERLQLDGVVDFFTGSINTTIPTGQSRLYRVDVPALAGQWQHTAVHAAGIQVFVQQGTVSPAASTANKDYNDWSSVDGFGKAGTVAIGAIGSASSTGANSAMSISLYRAPTAAQRSPWLVGRYYYILVKNVSGPDNAPFSLSMAGKYLNESDADKDGLPDAWEVEHFGDISKSPTQDSDNDGLSNAEELQAGTDPTKADTDGDGVKDGDDAFPLDPTESVDRDADGTGDNADLDDDNDNRPDSSDNCPYVANSTQVDSDGDGIGNACDLAVISFETGIPATGWTLSTPGWLATIDQASHLLQSLRAEQIAASQTATIAWRESFAAGPLEFDVKVSSQASKDFFQLSIDGVAVAATKKSGELGWTKLTVPMTAGVHTLTWAYTKDATIDTGADTVWIDNIRYTQGEDAIDTDGDGTMDYDDSDDDNDGVSDELDGLPKDPTETLDTDGDGIGNNADDDDDGDGLLDVDDPYPLDGLLWSMTEGTATNAALGKAAAYAGDVDNDGYGDTVVGAWKASPLLAGKPAKGAGAIYVLSGRTNALIPALSVSGAAAGDGFGYSVAGIGDVNGDNHDDIAVGAYRADHLVAGVLQKDTGSVTIISGANGSVISRVYGAFAGDRLGSALAAAGDVDLDGKPDVVAGAPLADRNVAGVVTKDLGSIRVYTGQTGALVAEYFGDKTKDAFGTAVAPAGDVNNDGYDDVIVGAPLADRTDMVNNDPVVTADVGHAQLLSGLGLIGGEPPQLLLLQGSKKGDAFGAAVAGNADIDNDGTLDVAVGAPRVDGSAVINGKTIIRKDIGRAFAFSGEDGSPLYVFDGEQVADNFGSAVSLARKLDGDNFADIVVGTAKADRINVVGTKTVKVKDAGTVSAYSGRVGTPLFSINGDLAGDYWGAAVDASGDFNNDGFSDLVIGAWGDDVPVTVNGKPKLLKNAGRVEVISGKAAAN